MDVTHEETSLSASADVTRLLAEMDQLSVLLADLQPVIRRLTRWEADGTLEHLDRVFHLLSAAIDAMTPEIIRTFVQTLAKLLEESDVLMHSQLAKVAPGLLRQVEYSLSASVTTERHGIRHLLHTLKDPQVQDGLEILLSVIRGLGAEHMNRAAHGN